MHWGLYNNFIILPWYPARLLQPLSHHHMDSLYSHHSYWERQRETERQRERMEREKALLTQTSSLSSLNKCIWLIFWGHKVTKKLSMLGKLGFGPVHVWLAFPLPWAGWSEGGSFQCLCTPGMSLSTKWLVCPCVKGSWLHEHSHIRSHLFPSVPIFPFTI